MTDTEARERFESLSPDERWSVMCSMKAMLEKKDETIAELREARRMRQAERFQPSSEKERYLFPELEVLADVLDSEPEAEEVTVASHKRKVRPHKKALTLPPDAPVYDIFHTQGCPGSFVKDGVTYIRSGEDEVIDKLAKLPSCYVNERHHYPVYISTSECGRGMNRLVVMRRPEVDGLGLSPSLVASSVITKFNDHVPYYTQEDIFRRDGIYVTRQRLCSAVVSYYQVLSPLERLFKDEVYRMRLLNKDETPVQVLDFRTGSGKVSNSSYMSITVGTTYDEDARQSRTLVLMEYIQGRSGKVLLEDIRGRGYQGHVMTDGYRPYLKIGDRHLVCWVHAVRNFKNILKANGKDKVAQEMSRLVAGLYVIEDRWRGDLLSGKVSPAQFLEGRKEEAGTQMAAIYDYAERLRPSFPPESAMGKAFNYLFTYREGLSRYTECLESTPDNNAAERVAKPFAEGRKCWLFFQTVDSADASAFLFSLIETAKASGLNPGRYLEMVLTFAPECVSGDDWKALLPWNADLSRLDPVTDARIHAQPDPGRKEPYFSQAFPARGS